MNHNDESDHPCLEASEISGLNFGARHTRKRRSLQACPANQSPVNIGFRDERVNIVGRYAPAIEDADSVGGFAVEMIAQRLTDRGVDVLILLGRGSPSGPDCPDGLVSYNYLPGTIGVHRSQASL
jgi:hypothetical protein